MQLIIILQFLLTIWLIGYLIRGDKGPKEPAGALLYAGLLGVFAVIVGSIVEIYLIPRTALPAPGQAATNISASTIAIACLGIGIIEELAKALPLQRFLYSKGYFNEVTDGIIYFGITGMIFGALENLSYAFSYGSAVGLMRIATIPFMHAGFTSIIGYSIARHKVLGTPKFMVTLGFMTAIALHALYDFGQFYDTATTRLISLGITVIANLVIFYLYRRAARADSRRIAATTL